jgi:hypothetical protein
MEKGHALLSGSMAFVKMAADQSFFKVSHLLQEVSQLDGAKCQLEDMIFKFQKNNR